MVMYFSSLKVINGNVLSTETIQTFKPPIGSRLAVVSSLNATARNQTINDDLMTHASCSSYLQACLIFAIARSVPW